MNRKSWHFYYYREEHSMRVKHYNGNKKIRKKNYSNTYSYIYFYNDFYWHKDIKLVKGK